VILRSAPSIYRFMIDVKHQGKGYGRAALARALDEIKATTGVKKVSIGYMLENAVAKQFYASFGSVEVGPKADIADHTQGTLMRSCGDRDRSRVSDGKCLHNQVRDRIGL
jgi:RimJ/RimL family protein N-acetyltransferase